MTRDENTPQGAGGRSTADDDSRLPDEAHAPDGNRVPRGAEDRARRDGDEAASLDRVLRDVDPAQRLTMDADRSARADDALSRILATDSAAAHQPARPARGRGRRDRGILGSVGRRRWAALAGVAAATLGVVGLASTTFLADQPAHAEWSAAPQPLTPQDRELAVDHCLDESGADQTAADGDAGGLEPALVERRGDAVAVVAISRSTELHCIAYLEAGADEARSAMWAQGDLGSDRKNDADRPGAQEISQEFSLTGLMPEDFGVIEAADGELTSAVTVVTGAVGEDVTGVGVTAPDGTAATATVANGRYVVWWPGEVMVTDDGETGEIHYRIELADGTIREGATTTDPPDPAPGDGSAHG